VRAGMTEYIERLEARLRADPGQWAVIEAIWNDAEEVGGQELEIREEKAEVTAGESSDG